MSVKEKLTQARDLIKSKRYDEARQLLKTIDHPLAMEWLDKLDQISSSQVSNDVRAKAVPAASKPPSNKLPVVGLVGMLLVSVVAGVGVGLLLYLSSSIVYLIFVSVIIAAAVVSYAMKFIIKVTKVRAALIAGLLAALSGGLAYGTYWYAEYSSFQNEMRQYARQEQPSIEDADVDTAIDQFLFEDTGQRGVLGYVLLTANEGMTITRARSSSSSGFTLSRELTLIYYGIEALIMIGGAGLAGISFAADDFCEETNEWFKFKLIGHVLQADMEDFLNRLNVGDFRGAGALITPEKSTSMLKIEAGRCSDTAPEAKIKIERVSQRNSKEIVNTTITSQQFEDLTA